MGNAFGMIPGLEPDEWSNDACRGYVIMAMENCGFSKKDNTKGCEVSVLSDTSSCMLAVEFEERTTGGVEDVCVR